MNIEGLLSEVRDDPLVRGYSGMTREQIWTNLNVVNRNLRQSVEGKIFAKWAATSGRMEGINLAQTTGGTNAIKSAARYIMLLINAFQGVNPDDTDDVAAINALVSAGAISSADRTALSALADKPVSRLVEIGNGDMPKAYFLYLMQQNNIST